MASPPISIGSSSTKCAASANSVTAAPSATSERRAESHTPKREIRVLMRAAEVGKCDGQGIPRPSSTTEYVECVAARQARNELVVAQEAGNGAQVARRHDDVRHVIARDDVTPFVAARARRKEADGIVAALLGVEDERIFVERRHDFWTEGRQRPRRERGTEHD